MLSDLQDSNTTSMLGEQIATKIKALPNIDSAKDGEITATVNSVAEAPSPAPSPSGPAPTPEQAPSPSPSPSPDTAPSPSPSPSPDTISAATTTVVGSAAVLVVLFAEGARSV